MLADPILEGSVHPFVNAILLGMAWLDANRSDPQLDPPARKLRDSSERECAAERRPVVADHLTRNAKLPEHPFKTDLCSGYGRACHGVDGEYISAERVGDRQRIAKRFVAHPEVPFVVSRHRITGPRYFDRPPLDRADATPRLPRSDQSMPRQNLAGRAHRHD